MSEERMVEVVNDALASQGIAETVVAVGELRGLRPGSGRPWPARL
jgi:hypothetical protein